MESMSIGDGIAVAATLAFVYFTVFRHMGL